MFDAYQRAYAYSVGKNVLHCLKQLTIREKLMTIKLPTRSAYALENCKRIFSGCFNVQYGSKSERLYHSVMLMVKEGRSNLQFKATGESLVYCDI